MTTLAADKFRAYGDGNMSQFPVIASDIIFRGSAVGIVAASGHARPLVAGDRFGGFAVDNADNSAGGAAAITVRCKRRGEVLLPVTGAVISDNESMQPVYAADDDSFSFSPVGGTFIGRYIRYTSDGNGIVAFNSEWEDPYAGFKIREALTSTKTFDAEDNGKLFWATGDATALTLPAVAAGVSLFIISGGAFGTQATTIDPNASDGIMGPDITFADNKDLINTKATQRRGDFVKLASSDADGWVVSELRGIWAREA